MIPKINSWVETFRAEPIPAKHRPEVDRILDASCEDCFLMRIGDRFDFDPLDLSTMTVSDGPPIPIVRGDEHGCRSCGADFLPDAFSDDPGAGKGQEPLNQAQIAQAIEDAINRPFIRVSEIFAKRA